MKQEPQISQGAGDRTRSFQMTHASSGPWCLPHLLQWAGTASHSFEGGWRVESVVTFPPFRAGVMAPPFPLPTRRVGNALCRDYVAGVQNGGAGRASAVITVREAMAARFDA